jgi:hypothetical protein
MKNGIKETFQLKRARKRRKKGEPKTGWKDDD